MVFLVMSILGFNINRLQYPTVSALIVAKGRGALLYKLDISRAYRNLHSDPLDWPLMCVQWPVDTFWIDTAIAFGLRTGAMMCQRTTNALVYIMQQRGFDLVNYIDDLAGCEESAQGDQAFATLRELLELLGLPEAPNKICTPATRMEFIGILFDSQAFTMSIPEDKLQDTG